MSVVPTGLRVVTPFRLASDTLPAQGVSHEEEFRTNPDKSRLGREMLSISSRLQTQTLPSVAAYQNVVYFAVQSCPDSRSTFAVVKKYLRRLDRRTISHNTSFLVGTELRTKPSTHQRSRTQQMQQFCSQPRVPRVCNLRTRRLFSCCFRTKRGCVDFRSTGKKPSTFDSA